MNNEKTKKENDELRWSALLPPDVVNLEGKYFRNIHNNTMTTIVKSKVTDTGTVLWYGKHGGIFLEGDLKRHWVEETHLPLTTYLPKSGLLVKFEHRSGEYEGYDSTIMVKEEANKYGDDVLKNHAHIVDTQYYLTQDEEWKEGHTLVKHHKRKPKSSYWFDVGWGDGVARVRSVKPISAEDVKVLRKWGVA